MCWTGTCVTTPSLLILSGSVYFTLQSEYPQPEYGAPVGAAEAPAMVERAIQEMGPQELYDLMVQMKVCPLSVLDALMHLRENVVAGQRQWDIGIGTYCSYAPLQQLLAQQPDHARLLLNSSPQLCYALLKAQLRLDMIDPATAEVRPAGSLPLNLRSPPPYIVWTMVCRDSVCLSAPLATPRRRQQQQQQQ